jgi:hypothetical protein
LTKAPLLIGSLGIYFSSDPAKLSKRLDSQRRHHSVNLERLHHGKDQSALPRRRGCKDLLVYASLGNLFLTRGMQTNNIEAFDHE